MLYECIEDEMRAAYAKSPLPEAKAYPQWARFSTVPYESATHGSRYVHNFATGEDGAYGRFEQAGEMPVGARMAKPSFTVGADGHGAVGPLFLMEKMEKGFNASSGDWKYSMVTPTGAVVGVTGGQNSQAMQFCAECHQAVGETQDHLYFLPQEVRTSSR